MMDTTTIAYLKSYVKKTIEGQGAIRGDDGVSVIAVSIDTSNNHLVTKMTDGSTLDAGEIPTAKGETGDKGVNGFSPTVEVKESSEKRYVLTITTTDGSFDTPNLKGVSNDLNSITAAEVAAMWQEG